MIKLILLFLISHIAPFMNTAGVFFTPSITVSELKDSYISAKDNRDKVKILIVPGHEPDFGGTEYHGLKERDIAVDLSEELSSLFDKNKFTVFKSRDKNDWNSDLKIFFKENWDTIDAWRDSYKNEMVRLFKTGEVKQITDGVTHNSASPDVARRLYAINKWVNEKDIDIAIHIHFNDNPRRNTNIPGDYSGFAIYIPEGQYSNYAATEAVASYINERLSKNFGVSSMPKEKSGIVQDQELVAIGRHNTVNSVSFLVEYSYIYEPFMQNKKVRDVLIKEFAYQTYLGIMDFFGEKIEKETTMLPYVWKDKNDPVDIAHLQYALLKQGLYPPEGKTKNDCPISGILGPCTEKSIDLFTKKYNIKKTELFDKLNELFGNNVRI